MSPPVLRQSPGVVTGIIITIIIRETERANERLFSRDGKAAASSAVSLSGRGVNLGAPPPRNVNNDIVFVLFFTLLKKGHRNLSRDTRGIRREG